MKRILSFGIIIAGATSMFLFGAAPDAHANSAPIAVSRVSINGGPASNQITLQRGQRVSVTFHADGSSDPDGWDTPGTGMSTGGRCEVFTPWEWGHSDLPRLVKNNPANVSECNFTMANTTAGVVVGRYNWVLFKMYDASGAVSSAETIEVTITDSPANERPNSYPQVSVNGGPLNSVYVVPVPQGVPVHIFMDASNSLDWNGWDTPGRGVSPGGKCEISTDFVTGNATYERTVANPPNSSACSYDYGMRTFNQAPGYYTYQLLRITDAGGLASQPHNSGNITFEVVSPTASNQPPVAISQVRADAGVFGSEITVTQGVPTRIRLGGDLSSDPNGWNAHNTGMSPGGKCEWNADLNRGIPTYEKIISNPLKPPLCSADLGTLTFNDTPGKYVYSVLRLTDAAGAVSNIGSVTIIVQSSTGNLAPVAVAKFSVDGGAPSPHIFVSRGVPVRIGLDAASSSDPNGWTASSLGVSRGGSCEWNTNLDQSKPTPFVKVISNPASPSSCNVNLGTLVFNDPPGTYTYALLRITDAGGLKSLITQLDARSRFAFSRLVPIVSAQSSDGTAKVTVVDGPTPIGLPTPCLQSGENSNCPIPTATPNCVQGNYFGICPTPKSTPIPSCDSFGYNNDCSKPTPTPTVTPTPTPTGINDPTPSPSATPDLCPPGSENCSDIIDDILNGIDNIIDAVQKFAEPVVTAITEIIAALLGVDPEKVAQFIREKGNLFASALAAIGAALSVPLVVTNIIPQLAQWGRFFGFFGARKRKDRWGIVVDSDLGSPVAGAVVQVFDAKFNQLKETQITGNDGQFGFLLPPGQYYVVVNKVGFSFPARKRPPLTLHDNERIYLGEEFTVADQDVEKIPHIVVPMDRDARVSTSRAMVARYLEIFLSIVDRVGFVFLITGGAVNTYVLLLNPNWLNISFEFLYLVLLALKFYVMVFHRREVGSVVDAVTKKQLDLAIVRLYDSKTNRIVQSRVTNKNGRFFLLIPKGTYTVAVSKQGYETFTMNEFKVKGKESQIVSLDLALKPIAQ